jgi:hypothetical protein
LSALERDSHDLIAVADALTEWSEFVSLARDSEPRFLAQVGVPRDWQSVVGRALSVSESLVKELPYSFDEATLNLEANALERISTAVDSIATVEGLLVSGDDLAERLRAQAVDLSDRADELQQHEDDGSDDDLAAGDEPFSIEGVMADL